MKEILETVQSAPKVIEDVYTDGVADTLKEASKIGVDAVKTIRLALFPLQFTAMAQDRLSRYISRSIESVPEENRITPPESLILPVAERLKYQEEDNPLTVLYLNLLSRGMDKERIGEAHPAFINIINQLSPDEVILLNQIGASTHFLIFMFDGEVEAYCSTVIEDYIRSLEVSDKQMNLLITHAFNRKSIAQPEILSTYLEHIVSLGLVVYDTQLFQREEFVELGGVVSYPRHYVQRLTLTRFGQLFHRACVNCERFT